MKLFVFAVNIITIISINIYGFSYSALHKSNESSESTAELNGFDQFEMPFININTASGVTVTSKETYTEAKISVINAQGVSEMTDSTVSVKLRGNATLNAYKKSYKLKFAEKQNMLNIGTGSGRTWCLISNCFDASLLRNLAVYRIADSLDGLLYSPNCISVELFVNNEYQGVYMLCEEINVNKNRVAIEENPDEIENNGYLIEMSRHNETDVFTVDKASFTVKSDLSQTESVKNGQIEYISGYMTNCISSLQKGDQTEAEQYMNIQSLVDIYIINEIVKNVDAGWSSFFMFKNAGDKLNFGPPWDFDLAVGNANCVNGFDSWAGINPYHVFNVNSNSNQWFCYALGNKWFRDLVQKRWNVLKDKLSTLPDAVTNEAETHNKSYCRNFEKWDNLLGKQVYIEPKQIASLTSYKEHYTYLSNWLENRIKWLTNYYASDDFLNGIFIDDSSKAFSPATNLIALSSILALTNSPDAKITYEILPTQGVTMSIENAGPESWSTQIVATGFMIEKGEQYDLSFDYKCSAAVTLPFCIQQNYEPYSSFYSKWVNCSEEIQHFQTVFKATKSDNNCALAFSLGGSDFNGTEITINNISLISKSSSNVNNPGAGKWSNHLTPFSYDSRNGILHLNTQSVTPVDLQMYSIIGRKVYAVSERLNAGKHIYKLNNIGLAPGSYIGQIRAGTQSFQWKIMIDR